MCNNTDVPLVVSYHLGVKYYKVIVTSLCFLFRCFLYSSQ